MIVRGLEDRTLQPMVVNIDTGEGLVATVTVPDGEDLRFERDGRVTLSARAWRGAAARFHGAVFADDAMAHANDFVFADADAPRRPARRPGDGRFAVTSPIADAFDPAPSLPHARPLVAPARCSPRRVPLGGLRAAPATSAAGRATRARSTSPPPPAACAGFFDESVFAPARPDGGAPSFEIGFEWDEREPFAVRVWLPRAFAALDGPDEPPVRERARCLLDRHRAAGVHVYVEYADPRWILGAGHRARPRHRRGPRRRRVRHPTWQDGTRPADPTVHR